MSTYWQVQEARVTGFGKHWESAAALLTLLWSVTY